MKYPKCTPIPEFASGVSGNTRQRSALDDILAGLRLWRLAWSLGWLDIRMRYRGSTLGPFWLTLSTGIMVASLGVLNSGLFHMPLRDYLPFLALSLVLWSFISTLVSDSCGVFTDAEALIRSMRTPYFLFAMRVLVRNILVLAHNSCIIIIMLTVLWIWPGVTALLVLLALPLWILDSLALSLLLGGFCARFRDIPPIVNSVMQIAFFLTPVIWKPEQLGANAAWLPFIPFFDLLEIIRAPMLGQIPSVAVWIGALVYSVILWTVTWIFFVRVRQRIAFWV